jgi:hypothetical protein
MPPSFWLRRGSASQGDATRAERGKPRRKPPCLGRRQRQPCLCTPTSRYPLVHPTRSLAWRRGKPLQDYAHLAMPEMRRVMHKSLRPAFLTTHIPATRPPVGLRLRDSFLFVNGFSLVCRRGTISGATSRVQQIALASTIERNTRFRLSTVHPRPGAVIHRHPRWLKASPLPPAPRRRLGLQSRAGIADRHAWRARYSGRGPGCASAGRQRSP